MSSGNDAWNIPGWTAQNPVYPANLLEIDPPTLPLGVSKCVITGTYMAANGLPYSSGTVRFTPTVQRTLILGTEVLLPMVRAEVNKGRLSADIYAIPQDVIWEVTESVGPTRLTYEVIVPLNTVTADLTTLERVTPDTVRPPLVRTGQIFTGHGAPPDPVPGAVLGDTYIDLDTGDVWTLS